MDNSIGENEIALRLKCRKGTNIRIKVELGLSLVDFFAQIEALTDIPSHSVVLLKDYPPKKINYDLSKGTVMDLGLKSQDTLIVEADPGGGGNASDASTASVQSSEPPPLSTLPGSLPSEPANHDTETGITDDIANGILLRHVVPSDNSCLFSSVAFCLGDREVIQGNNYLRQVIADTVRGDPVKYDEAFLGRGNAEYSSWIMKPEAWGGAIEVAILSERFHCEIVVVNILSANLARFGEDKGYDELIFLLYDGIHYDPLYLETFETHQKIFPRSRTSIYAMAVQLAKEAKATHQFTDLKNFALKCNTCGTYLKGEREAQAHAKTTRHTDFSEVKSSTDVGSL